MPAVARLSHSLLTNLDANRNASVVGRPERTVVLRTECMIFTHQVSVFPYPMRACKVTTSSLQYQSHGDNKTVRFIRNSDKILQCFIGKRKMIHFAYSSIVRCEIRESS